VYVLFCHHSNGKEITQAMKPNNLVNENPRSELTIEKLRTYKGFETITDAEAEIHIIAIKKLARVLYGVYLNEQKEKLRKENPDC